MPTYAELQAEPWWNREIVPEPLRDMGGRLCSAYGRPLNAYGVKGDNLHLYGSHRSQEWILNSRYATSRTNTVQSGLTAEQLRHVAGFDFNPGSTARMMEICARLDREVRAGRLEQVLAWYGNLDGDNRVDGYDNIRNRLATSDSSHLWHLHMTLDRRLVADAASMRRVADVLLGQASTQEEVDPLIGLKLGDTGQPVYALQNILRRAGHDPGPSDGQYGPKVAAAVLACRKAMGSAATSGAAVNGDAYAQIMAALARAYAGKDGEPGKDGKDGAPGQPGAPGRTPTHGRMVVDVELLAGDS
jgi:hypothetical protein